MTRFIPNDHSGSRQETAVLLIGTAREFGIDTHEVRTARGRTGFNISDRLADVLDDEQTKTSGNRAEKNKKSRKKGKA